MHTGQQTSADDKTLLAEIRRRWTYAADAWREIREEGATDMRYVAGDPWDPKDRKARVDAGRPCLSLDELGQYVNQLINDVRQNERAIKVTPIGDGANEHTARVRADLIRQIEYRSNAQQAYTTTFENAVQRSFGFHRVTARYVSDHGFDQELVIEPLPNPDDVTPDPDSIKSDGSDWRYCFVRESRTHEEFKREFPKAQIASFDTELIASAPQWLTESKVYLAEYWTKEVKRRELLALRVATTGGGTTEQIVFADELEKGALERISKENILRRRPVDETSVVQYLTNGVEILKKTDWPGKRIPIVPCYGKILYVDEGAGSKRKIMSMVRLARDPYMLYCYYRTCEAELVGMTPKTPVIGYTGQFRGHEDKWATINATPHAYIEANPFTESTGTQVLPLPTRQPYDPPIQALEIGAESARRAIQSAMGSSPLPTSAQRRNEKSGVALKQIEDTAQKGSYHFIDHYDEAIQATGAILNELIPHYYDTARDVTVRKADDTAQQVRINDPQSPDPEAQQPLLTTQGEHDVTIATGPSYDSEREAASDFADLLLQQPQVFALIAPLVIKLKNLGPIGDQIAEILTVMAPPQVQAILNKGKNAQGPDAAQLQQQLAEAIQMVETLKGELDAKTRAVETDAAKAQVQLQIAELKAAADHALELLKQENENLRAAAQADLDLALAEIKVQADLLKTRATLEQNQTTAMLDAAVQQTSTEVAAAGAAEERQMRSEEAEAGRQHASEEAERGRQHEASQQPEASE
jgi:hypothetical protein